MSESEVKTPEATEEQLQPQIDVNRIGCRIVDVHQALQKSFEEFVEKGDNTLDGLASKIQEMLSGMPVFIIGDQMNQ